MTACMQRRNSLTKHWLRLVLVGLFGLAACTANPADELQNSKIVYGLTLNVSGIDPHINRSTELGIVLRQVYDTLVYRHPDTREFVPGLAQSWEISDDGMTYTFLLREDVTFHDGTPFNADAVAANLARILAPETASQRARFLLGPIVGYEVVDEYTIRMVLSQPFEPFLDALSQIYLAMASPTALAEYAAEPLRYQYHQVGTGPFKFVEYLPEDRIVIRRNADYAWGPEFYGNPGEDAVQEVEFRFFSDEATRLLSLENGAAEIMGEIPPVDARSLASDEQLALLPVNIPGEPVQFYMNTAVAPTDDIRVRQALIYAANRNAIVDAVFGAFSPVAWGPLASSTLYYNRGVEGVYAYNIAQAELLLEQAGYVDEDGDGIRERNGEPLQIIVLQPPWSSLPDINILLEDQWETIGIDVDLQSVPGYVALIEAVAEGVYNLVPFDQPGLDPYILNQSYLSDAPDNWTNYSNPELDSVLIEAAQTSDVEQRRLLYGRAQAIIMEQALILPVREYVNLNAYNRDLQGLRFDPYGWFPLLHDVSVRRGS